MLEKVSEPVVETLAANSMKRQEANKVAAKSGNSKEELRTATEAMELQKKFDEEGFVEDFQKGNKKMLEKLAKKKKKDLKTVTEDMESQKESEKMLEVSEPVVETLAANSIKRQEANKVAAKSENSKEETEVEKTPVVEDFDEEGFVEDFQKGKPKKFNDNLPKLSQSKLLVGVEKVKKNEKRLEKVSEPVTVAAKKKEKQAEKTPVAENFDEEGFGEDFQKGEPKKFNTDLPKLSRKDKKKEQANNKSKIATSKMESSGASACEEVFSLSPVQQFANGRGKIEIGDIKIDCLSIEAGSLEILSNASFSIAMGRRYDLVDRNGSGKTTLLRHIAEKKLQIPPHIDVLLCEQEVVADEKTPVTIILNADTERCKLMEERQKLKTYQEKNGENMEKITERLHCINSEWKAIGADSAEPKARRLLSGLGFDS
ncbi:hypothetical protein QYM36_016747 [Artemia franciscana]|uniref:ABC transporter domain-containing protein n=1 Tax=Artemia franciscana TaxID=6661 RepID=A0AA88H8Z2_ARTSF|nr:hypothetical protein QYM36_016747 [Artemia franciscana]